MTLPPALLEQNPWQTNKDPIWLASVFVLRRNLSQYLFPAKIESLQGLQVFQSLREQLLKISSLSHPVCLEAQEMNSLDKEFLFERFLCIESFQNTLAGQGFVCDDSSHFLAILNVQDHLQLLWTDYSGQWENCLQCLCSIEKEISLPFAFNAKFGYLTSSPSLCGTALTVYIHLHLPALIHTQPTEEFLIKQGEEGVEASGIQGADGEFIGDLVVLHNSYTIGVNKENILSSLHAFTMKLLAAERSIRTHMQAHDSSLMKDLVGRAYGLIMNSYQLQTKEALNALSLIKLGLNLKWINGVSDTVCNDALFGIRKGHLLQLLQAPFLNPEEIPRKRATFLHKKMEGLTLLI